MIRSDDEFLKPFFELEKVNKELADLKAGKLTPEQEEMVKSLEVEIDYDWLKARIEACLK